MIATDRSNILDTLRAQLSPHRLPCVQFLPRSKPANRPWQSRLGGAAYWPAERNYPRTPSGEPLHLLLQLNLEEIPALDGYPREGVLQFFIAEDVLSGEQFKERRNEPISCGPRNGTHQVVYHREASKNPATLLESLLLASPPSIRSTASSQAGEYALTFEPGEDLPAATDHRFEALVGDMSGLADDVVDTIYDSFTAEGCRLGGYATFTRDDPRAGYPPGEWLLLLQLDTVIADGINIRWGNGGTVHFFIHRDDLARRDFSRVWFYWDNG